MPARTRKPVRLALIAGGVAVALGAGVPALANASEGPLSTIDPDAASEAPATVATDETLADSPALYALTAADAWARQDGALLARLATPAVAQLLLARDPGGEAWGPQQCEGAAGSTYCSWTSPEVTFTLRVENEAASNRMAWAVKEARFTLAPEAVAIWPLTTAQQAANTQASVDAGHSPWHLDPRAVVEFFAQAELGFEQPVVQVLAPTFFTYRVSDAPTGIAADVEVTQPARTDETGIWAVASVRSAAPDPVGI